MERTTKITNQDLEKRRCSWCQGDEDLIRYHDTEWAVPTHNDKTHFEFLTLEIMQCGLNWRMILRKRSIISSCFDQFDFHKIAEYGPKEVEKILKTEGMIKNRRKINATIHNARCFLNVRKEYGSFDAYIWKFTNGAPVLYESHKGRGTVVAKNELSDKVSKDLKKRGFQFTGSITVYSFLQASGIINDHEKDCFLDEVIREKYPASSQEIPGPTPHSQQPELLQ